MRPNDRLLILPLAWSLALGAVAFTRFRGEIAQYKALHRWLADRGVPDAIRHLDSLVIFVFAAFIGAVIAAAFAGGSVPAHLSLRRGRPGWLRMVPAALAPMIIGGAIAGWSGWTAGIASGEAWPKLLSGVVRAPIAEELLFRGLLVGVVAAIVGWSGRWFWINTFAAALLFASVHVEWTPAAFARGWATLLVTALGGAWYAWLLARWRSLWVPMLLHAGMNLGWMLAAAPSGAGGGGLVENLLRAATITIATWWTIRGTRGDAVPMASTTARRSPS